MEEPIRVAHIMGKMVGGGVESFIMNYYRNIDTTKIQFDFVIDSDSTVIPRKEIEELGGRIYEIAPYQKIWKYMKELKIILKNNKYQIVHSHLNALSVFPLGVAFFSKIPIRIAHSHSTTNKKEWKKNIVKNLLKPFSKLFATHYFACSEHAARWLFGNKMYEKGNVEIIHNAIDVDKFKYDNEIRKKIRKELNIENKFVIGHVGRFVKQKNHEFLIDIFSEIYIKNKDSILLLIGEGPLENKIKEKIKKMHLENAVYFLGVKDNVNEYMQALDVFAFPSLYEGLGIVAIESQVAGVRTICSEKVPKEVNITNSVAFIEFDIKKWQEEILNFNNSNVCNILPEKLELYDIKKEIKRYQKIMINLFIERNKINE